MARRNRDAQPPSLEIDFSTVAPMTQERIDEFLEKAESVLLQSSDWETGFRKLIQLAKTISGAL